MNKVITLIGAGGFAREVASYIAKETFEKVVFFVEDEFVKSTDNGILPLSTFDVDKYKVLIAIGDPNTRQRIADSMPKNTEYFTYISKDTSIGDDVVIGEGSIICPGTIITTNVNIGTHAHLNLHTSIGHDCNIGNYFTTAPGARVSGNCLISHNVYLGTNASVRQSTYICSNVVVGLNAGVVKDISEEGVYVGVPARKLKS